MLTLATDYPFWDVFWTILIFMCWVIWIWMVILVLIDIFSRIDLSGWGKAGWVVLIIVLPFIGVLIYLIAQHDGMAQRSLERAQTAQQQFDEHVKAVAAGDGGGAASEIEKAQQLLENGTISQAEFDAIKAKALAAH